LQKARYIQFFGGKTYPRKLDAKHIEKFLSHLATKGNVAASTQRQALNPDYAIAEFAEDARRRVRRRTLVLQAPDNKADSVKSATPCGFKCQKNNELPRYKRTGYLLKGQFFIAASGGE
jgi:hypothetical protein